MEDSLVVLYRERGGREAEQEERQRWNQREQQRILNSVKGVYCSMIDWWLCIVNCIFSTQCVLIKSADTQLYKGLQPVLYGCIHTLKHYKPLHVTQAQLYSLTFVVHVQAFVVHVQAFVIHVQAFNQLQHGKYMYYVLRCMCIMCVCVIV